jgi:hypothetical protein
MLSIMESRDGYGEGEIRSWALFAWSVAAYTVGCGALSWWNQRRVGLVRGLPGAFLAAGVLEALLAVVFGRWTDRLLRARLRAAP